MAGLTPFQIILANDLQGNVQPFLTPNISLELAIYNEFDTVSKYAIISDLVAGESLSFLNSIAITSLEQLGANSFPQLFGAIPSGYTSSIGTGTLFDKIVTRLEKYVNINNSSVAYQTIANASLFASQTNNNINQLTTNQNSDQYVSGGISSFAGNTSIQVQTVSQAFANIGNVIDFTNLPASFSASNILLPLAQQNSPIANLQVNLFGQSIIDPRNGNVLIINTSLLQRIISNPISSDGIITATVSQNPLEAPLIVAANNALTNVGDLDAMCSYLNISGNAASSIFQFSDMLNVELMFDTATPVIKQNLGITSAPLTIPNVVDMLQQNLTGAENITSSSTFSNALAKLQSIENLNQVLIITTLPIITANVGIGLNGSLTTSDILGSSNVTASLVETISAISAIPNTVITQNIDSDINNLVVALQTNSIPGPLSDGQIFSTVNDYVVGCTALINSNAIKLLSTVQDTSFINSYNVLAQTHNNSITFLNQAGIDVDTIHYVISDAMDFVNDLPIYALDSIGTVDFINPMLSGTSLAGQAAQAVIIDTQNTQVLTNLGLVK